MPEPGSLGSLVVIVGFLVVFWVLTGEIVGWWVRRRNTGGGQPSLPDDEREKWLEVERQAMSQWRPGPLSEQDRRDLQWILDLKTPGRSDRGLIEQVLLRNPRFTGEHIVYPRFGPGSVPNPLLVVERTDPALRVRVLSLAEEIATRFGHERDIDALLDTYEVLYRYTGPVEQQEADGPDS